jgi:D-glycero-D-manno-heptose 1,7-bisphosphate phosphatase
MKKAVFLDRDGVINKAIVIAGLPTPPKSLEEVEILDGATEAIALLKKNSFEVIVVTNQPDVSRGNQTRERVELINHYLSEELGIEHFFTCFHDDLDNCNCRKPKPGLIFEAARLLGIDTFKSFMIGDRWRDISAGQSAGCRCFHISNDYLEKSPEMPFVNVLSLMEATKLILENAHETLS